MFRYLALGLLFANAAEAAPRVTTEINFAIGSVDVGAVDGFTAPGGHFDLGVTFGNLRFQGELDRGLWTDESKTGKSEEPVDPNMPLPSTSGSFSRFGLGARYYPMNLTYKHEGMNKVGMIRVYVEGSVGVEAIEAPAAKIRRNDVAFGMGFTQESPVGPLLLGGHIGLRVIVADPPVLGGSMPVCRGVACSTIASPSKSAHDDLAMFIILGMVFGK